jgi:hypothetical protein
VIRALRKPQARLPQEAPALGRLTPHAPCNVLLFRADAIGIDGGGAELDVAEPFLHQVERNTDSDGGYPRVPLVSTGRRVPRSYLWRVCWASWRDNSHTDIISAVSAAVLPAGTLQGRRASHPGAPVFASGALPTVGSSAPGSASERKRADVICIAPQHGSGRENGRSPVIASDPL